MTNRSGHLPIGFAFRAPRDFSQAGRLRSAFRFAFRASRFAFASSPRSAFRVQRLAFSLASSHSAQHEVPLMRCPGESV